MSEAKQSDNAIKFYESRSRDYDDTWHTDFTKRFLSYLDVKPGQTVLDLACGTGLLTFLEADAVGTTGKVVAVDVTPGMLAMAKHKQSQSGENYSNVTFVQGDILQLHDLEELKGMTFDIITVCSALVLFPEPRAALEHWSEFLKPGGYIAVDATHPRNLVSGMVLERVARRLNLPIPYNRSWSKSESSLRKLLESAGLEVEQIVTVENQAGYGKRHYELEQWDDFFVENVIVKDVTRTFANNSIRRQAQGLYKEEWEKLAVDGKVEEVDSVFLGVARKLSDGSRYVATSTGDEIIFKGGCRCGGVQYTSKKPSSDITLCHCRACQQLSGAPCLPFVDVPKDGLHFEQSSTSKTLKLSDIAERTFCTGCGTPISMFYNHDPEHISLTVSSMDFDNIAPEHQPKVARHIFLREKAPWLVLPEDGAERWGTAEFAHLLT